MKEGKSRKILIKKPLEHVKRGWSFTSQIIAFIVILLFLLFPIIIIQNLKGFLNHLKEVFDKIRMGFYFFPGILVELLVVSILFLGVSFILILVKRKKYKGRHNSFKHIRNHRSI